MQNKTTTKILSKVNNNYYILSIDTRRRDMGWRLQSRHDPFESDTFQVDSGMAYSF